MIDTLARTGDGISWKPVALVEKWDPSQVALLAGDIGREPSAAELAAAFAPERMEVRGNLLTTAGLGRLTSLMIGAGGQAATATATRLGVGNSSTAEAVGQTDLQAAVGAANRQFKVMDAGFPTAAGGVMTFKSTFAADEANFPWAEWGVEIAAPTVVDGTTVNGILLNRKVGALGTKAAGAIWTLTCTITIA